MKATGIVRRIDDLGRVVIPKEIRRTMRIREEISELTAVIVFDSICWATGSGPIVVINKRPSHKLLVE